MGKSAKGRRAAPVVQGIIRFPRDTRVDLGQWGNIFIREHAGTFDVLVSLTADALKVLNIRFDFKGELELNELRIEQIRGDRIISYVEETIQTCKIFGKPSGEVIAKFTTSTGLDYSNGKLEADMRVSRFDTTSSGVCTITGATITIWRSWFTRHFYGTVNRRIPEIIRDMDLPYDRIWVASDRVNIASKVDKAELVKAIIDKIKDMLGIRAEAAAAPAAAAHVVPVPVLPSYSGLPRTRAQLASLSRVPDEPPVPSQAGRYDGDVAKRAMHG